jgi:hypothetical protein
MSRLVRVQHIEAGAADLSSGDKSLQEKIKDYGERVAKYVPAEVLAFYTAAAQVILTKEGSDNAMFRLWSFAIVGIIAWVGTWFWLGLFSEDQLEKRTNQIMGVIAFGVWAYAYPAGWVKEFGWYDPVVAALLLLVFSFWSGFVQPKIVDASPAQPQQPPQPAA